MGYQVLLAEDEARMRDIVRDYLAAHGWACDLARNGAECLDLLRDHDYDALLLDVLMPELDGFAVCRAVRCGSGVPILFLTALGGEEDVLRGYALGADDYVTKPFSFREMVSRVRAQLRRTQWEKDDPTVRRYGKLTIFLNEHRAAADGKTLNLSPKEYDILCKLMEKPNWVVTREQLLSSIWGDEYEGEMRTVDMHMTNLRRKLDEAGAKDYIQTVRAVGYKMKPLEEKAE